MRVLGFDPGMIRLGFGAVSVENQKIELITYGLIANPRDPQHTHNQHLNAGIQQLCTDLPRLIDLTNPHIIVAETVPSGRLGSNSELVVGAITVCKVIAFQFGIPWYDMGANTIKKQVTGDGTATKTKVRNAMLDMFPIVEQRHKLLKQEQKEAGQKAEGLAQDVFDGLAIAVTGAYLHGMDK